MGRNMWIVSKKYRVTSQGPAMSGKQVTSGVSLTRAPEEASVDAGSMELWCRGTKMSAMALSGMPFLMSSARIVEASSAWVRCVGLPSTSAGPDMGLMLPMKMELLIPKEAALR